MLLDHLDFPPLASFILGPPLTSFYDDESRGLFLFLLTVIGGFLEGVLAKYFIFCPLAFLLLPSFFHPPFFLFWLFIIRLDETEELGNLVIPHYTGSTTVLWGFFQQFLTTRNNLHGTHEVEMARRKGVYVTLFSFFFSTCFLFSCLFFTLFLALGIRMARQR